MDTLYISFMAMITNLYIYILHGSTVYLISVHACNHTKAWVCLPWEFNTLIRFCGWLMFLNQILVTFTLAYSSLKTYNIFWPSFSLLTSHIMGHLLQHKLSLLKQWLSYWPSHYPTFRHLFPIPPCDILKKHFFGACTCPGSYAACIYVGLSKESRLHVNKLLKNTFIFHN